MQSHTNRIARVLGTLSLLTVLTGCETEPSDQAEVRITPASVTMRTGQSQEFTASGWQDYTWSLSDPSLGVLSTTKGDRTVYTATSALSSDGTTTMQTLTVKVNTSSTVNTPEGPDEQTTSFLTAEAFISLVEDDIDDETIATSISPSLETIELGESVELKAVGPAGVTDYAWTLQGDIYGTLSSTTGPSTIFTATTAPATTDEPPLTQIVRLTSNGGKTTTTAAISITAFTP